MPLPTQASRSHAFTWRSMLALVILTLTLGFTPAFASRYVVDINGGGDFTTIQAAIDAQAGAFRDTVLVMPGAYAEALTLPATTRKAYIVSLSGASVTSARTLVPPAVTSTETRIEGFTFTDAVVSTTSPRTHFFFRCVFRGSVSSFGNNDIANYYDCDFYGRTRFYGYHGSLYPTASWSPFENLRFHGAPLEISPYANGDNAMRNCTFEGPADTLVYVPGEFDFVHFESCRFSGARQGLVYGGGSELGDGVWRCRFYDLVEYGVRLGPPTAGRSASIEVDDSRFERCGTAVSWVVTTGYGGKPCSFLRDTILASTGNGIELGRSYGSTVTQSVFDGNGGHGLLCLQLPNRYDPPYDLSVTQSRFSNNGGDGLHIEETGLPAWYADARGWSSGVLPVHRVSQSVFTENGGAGLRVVSPRWDIHDCVAIHNGGDGVSASTPGSLGGCTLVGNTSVHNLGDGFHVPAMGPPGDTVVVQHNLAALNAGVGIQAPQYAFQSYAFNDAWGNYLGQHFAGVSPSDSNLTVDPRFCDLSAGLAGLGLQQGSPCGAGGVYGLIGARPESCPNTTTVDPPAPEALAFAVRPAVARGSVEFVPPASGAEGVVELFDLAGRVVWRSPLGPASGVVRWHGEGEGGRVGAGLYWARFTRGVERATRRLVWLD